MKWSTYQQDIFKDVGKGTGHTIVSALAGTGKCLGINTPILMFDGSIKPVQDVKIGDKLMGPNSKPRTVLNTNIGTGNLFKIIPKKGESWVCNDSHILTLAESSKKGKVIDISISDFMSKYGHYKDISKQWKLFKVGVNFENTFVLKYDPYFIGLWIGDGSKSKVSIYNIDEEIINYCNEFAKANKLFCNITKEKTGCSRIDFAKFKLNTKWGSKTFPLRKFLLNDCKLGNSKNIPTEYLTASRNVRLHLLAGIIDSDGSLSGNNTYEVTSVSEHLANQYCFLARSLGFWATKKMKTGTIKKINFTGTYYRVHISGDTNIVPVKLFRKKAKVRKQIKNVLHTGFSIEDIGIGNYYGFTLDGDGRFLLGDFTVTHNTTTIIESFKYIPRGKKTLMVAFNKSIATELRERAPSYVDCLTLHSLGLRAIKKRFGNDVVVDKDKAQAFVDKRITKFAKSNSLDIKKLKFDYIQNICHCVSLCKATLSDSPKDIESIIEEYNIELFDLSLQEFTNIVIKTLGDCKSDTTCVDFDDMIWFPFVLRLKLPVYDYVFCDEYQDLNRAQNYMVIASCKKTGRIFAIGDRYQCVSENTSVILKDKTILINELNVGDEILSFKNGNNCFQKVTNITKSDIKYGIKITTETGKSLIMTPEHQIWASPPEKQHKDQVLVYLMYRYGYGFRVGVTNKGYTYGDNREDNNISSRLVQEGGDKLWILDICDDRASALYKEEFYSLKYSIPTAVFNGEARGLDQNYIDSLFKEFGGCGEQLLLDKKLNFNLPHWSSYSAQGAKVKRTVIGFVEHAKKCSQVTLEWSNDIIDLCSLLDVYNIKYTSAKGKNRFRIRKFIASNKEALQFALLLKKATGCEIRRTLSSRGISNVRMCLLNAASLFIGQKVAVKNNDSYMLDRIVSIKNIKSTFYDVEVNDSCNFYGNDILSHNCIYGFRGANINAMDTLKEKLGAKELSLPVTYRCPKKVVYLAQKVVPHYAHGPNAPDGVVKYVSGSNFLSEVRPGDFILSRTNAPLIKYCLKLLNNNVPANIQGRDIGKNLIWFVKKSKKKTIKGFLNYTKKWRDEEVNRVKALGRSPQYYIDKAECIFTLCDSDTSAKSTDDLIKTIKRLFDDVDDTGKVVLSTTHRAKGLERDRVFMLSFTYRFSASDSYKNDYNEEKNIWYVAVTRAKKELYLVSKEEKSDDIDDMQYS